MRNRKQIIALVMGITFCLVIWITDIVLDKAVGNVSITFYGRLVDQDGAPIPGATVTGEVHGMSRLALFLPPNDVNKWHVSTVTDQRGNFFLSGGHGQSLRLSADVPGYIGDCGSARYYASYYKTPDTTSQMFHANPDKPVILHFWKVKGPHHDAELDIRAHLSGEARMSTVDLIKSASSEGKQAIGDLRVSFEVPSGNGEWIFKAEAIDGGFSLADHQFYFEAPEEGYTSSLSFDMGNRDLVQKLRGSHYYLRSRGGKVYAAVLMYPDVKTMTVYISYRINTDGSRLLEP